MCQLSFFVSSIRSELTLSFCQESTEANNELRTTNLTLSKVEHAHENAHSVPCILYAISNIIKLECGPMPSLMAALPNIGDALC